MIETKAIQLFVNSEYYTAWLRTQVQYVAYKVWIKGQR